MSRVINAAIPVTLLLSALSLSSCASKPEPTLVAEPAPAVTAVEKPVVPEAAPEPAPAAVAEPPAVRAEPVPKPAIKKSKKIAVKHAPPKASPPPPVMVPAPIVEQPPPPALPPEPIAPVKAAPPVEKIAEPGFLERYWLWLLGLAVIVAAVFAWLWRGQERKQ